MESIVEIGKVYEICHLLKDQFIKGKEEDSVFIYKGNFDKGNVSVLSEKVENILIQSSNNGISYIKRVFSVLVEGIENSFIHGVKDKMGKRYGHLYVIKNEKGIAISFGNLIESKDVDYLKNYIGSLNTMKTEDIRLLYLSTLSQNISGTDARNGLGLISTRLKSKSKIHFQFYPIDVNNTYFERNVIVYE